MHLFGLTVSALPAVPCHRLLQCPGHGCTAGPYMHKGTKAWSSNPTLAVLPRAAESKAVGSQLGRRKRC